MGERRTVLVAVRISPAESAVWRAKVERERTRQVVRIGNNLNQVARWANTHKTAAEAVEVIAHLITIERALAALKPAGNPDSDAR